MAFPSLLLLTKLELMEALAIDVRYSFYNYILKKVIKSHQVKGARYAVEDQHR